MYAGMNPQMIVDDAGRLIAIATGSDAITEHECGSADVQRGLTRSGLVEIAEVAMSLRASQAKRGAIGSFAYPDLMESKRIRAGLDRWAYGERMVTGVPEASLVCSVKQSVKPFGDGWVDRQLAMHGKDLAGAWDGGSCGFRVRGAAQVEQLRAFAEAIASSRAIFAGTFLRDGPSGRSLSGVIIAIEDLLPPGAQTDMSAAQSKFEVDVRLAVRSRVAELHASVRQHLGRSIGFIWPVWKDQRVDGDVVYALNPGSGVDAVYYGPYDFEQLQDWLVRGALCPLRTRRCVPDAESTDQEVPSPP